MSRTAKRAQPLGRAVPLQSQAGVTLLSSQQGAETTKGAFQSKSPWLKRQHSAWVLWTRAGCDPCKPRDISFTGAVERSRLPSVLSVPPAHSTHTWHTHFWQPMGTFGHRRRESRDTKHERALVLLHTTGPIRQPPTCPKPTSSQPRPPPILHVLTKPSCLCVGLGEDRAGQLQN